MGHHALERARKRMRYDQPVHLAFNNGEVRPVLLSRLTPALVASSEDATIHDDEGWGVYPIARAPLDRKGFTFKFELGTAGAPGTSASAVGVGSWTRTVTWGMASVRRSVSFR